MLEVEGILREASNRIGPNVGELLGALKVCVYDKGCGRAKWAVGARGSRRGLGWPCAGLC